MGTVKATDECQTAICKRKSLLALIACLFHFTQSIKEVRVVRKPQLLSRSTKIKKKSFGRVQYIILKQTQAIKNACMIFYFNEVFTPY